MCPKRRKSSDSPKTNQDTHDRAQRGCQISHYGCLLEDSKSSIDDFEFFHSSVDRIKVGEEAYFHLHLWREDLRKAGLGIQFCRESIALYFDRLRLQRLWCEPFAGNPAPNRTVQKLGLEFVKEYRTVPGTTAFEQDVNLYRLLRPGSQ